MSQLSLVGMTLTYSELKSDVSSSDVIGHKLDKLLLQLSKNSFTVLLVHMSSGIYIVLRRLLIPPGSFWVLIDVKCTYLNARGSALSYLK